MEETSVRLRARSRVVVWHCNNDREAAHQPERVLSSKTAAVTVPGPGAVAN